MADTRQASTSAGKAAGARVTPGTLLLAGGVIASLVWLVLYPNLFVLGDSVLDGGRLTLAHYARFMGSAS